ncbi:FG-GAP repeat domain-containing protein, partial [Rhodocaloribacter sp.]
MKKRTGVAAVILGVWSLTACASEEASPYVWHEAEGYRWAELAAPGHRAPGFEALDPAEAGLTFVNTLSQEQFLANRHYVNGSGVALADVDGDGWTDVYLARLEGPNALYRNLGAWRFEDVTEAAGVAAAGRFSTGAAFEDLDGDGDVDLLVTAMGGPNAVYLNDGAGHFTEATAASGLASHAGATSMALADVDGDGDLDLYVGHYKKHTVRDLIPPFERTFEQSVVRKGEGFALRPEFAPHYELRRQGNRLMRFEYGEADAFYRNDGAGRFTRVPFTGGAFLDEDGRPLETEPRDWALTVRFQDVNGDGAPDLYVCNDFESPDHFWINRGDGTFRAIDRLAVRKTSQSTMSVDFADVDANGRLDFFLADMLSRRHERRMAQVGMPPPELARPGVIDDRPQVMQNTLSVDRGDGTYAEVANLAGVAASEWTWSTFFLDADLDGDPDLLLTNGHAYDAMDADTQMRNASMPPSRDWRKELLRFPGLSLKNIAFRNDGEYGFTEVPDGWGIGETPDVAHGMAAADLDHDGDLDLVTNRLNAPAGLFRNTAAAPRLLVRLR